MRPVYSAELCVLVGDIIYIILHNDIDLPLCLLWDRFRSHTCVCTTTTVMHSVITDCLLTRTIYILC